MSQTPTIGRIVHYRLSAVDAEQINRRREDFVAYQWAHSPDPATRPVSGQVGATGHVAHVGNRAREGDVCPAMVVRNNGGSVNLQVMLDGSDTLWATSRVEGEGPGTWSWPPRV